MADFAFWRLPLGELPVGRGEERAAAGDGAAAFDFWRLPLGDLLPEDAAATVSLAGRKLPRDTRQEQEPAAAADFWRLPLPELRLEDEKPQAHPPQAGRRGGTAGADASGVTPASTTPPTADVAERADERAEPEEELAELEESEAVAAEEVAAETADGAAAEAAAADVVQAPKPRNLAMEMAGMLDNYRSERRTFEKNLAELRELQERLQALTIKAAGGGHTTKAEGDDYVQKDEPLSAGCLPPEVLDRAFWLVDVAALGRAASASREWLRQSRSKGRWRRLCDRDWSISNCASYWDYRSWLRRFRLLQNELAGLSGSGAPSGVTGSTARKRLTEALEVLVELGTAPNPNAHYPSQLPGLLSETSATKTLLALLEDESPHLLCLVIRCLADVAMHEGEREHLRAEITRRGTLVRTFLEGDDMDIVEAAARMMLNLHAGGPGTQGTPIAARRRGPRAFALESDLDWPATPGSSVPVTPSSPGVSMASAWAGAWEGEMRYARCGDRHAALRLVLGVAGAPATEQAVAALLGTSEASAEAAGAEATEGGTGGRRRQMLRAEGCAQYWNYFGFLAASDFDCASETASYVDEVIERRRQQPSSPSSLCSRSSPLSATQATKLAGAGWDEQNGPFMAEATVPLQGMAVPPSCGGAHKSEAAFTANAVPLRLTLKYLTRGGTFEFTAFLAGGDEPVLYGVWATAPSHHKHLFALRRAVRLPPSLTASPAAALAPSL